MKVFLTIAIPTYDRPSQIVKRIEELLPQILGKNIQIIVLDNNSPQDVNQVLRECYRDEQLAQVDIIKNPDNVGLSANVCKCFENASGEWLWILGDDDSIYANSVHNILKTISALSDEVAYVNFSTEFNQYQSDLIIASTNEFVLYLKKNKNFSYPVSNLVYLSTSCYRTNVYKNLVRHGYLAATSHCPHFAMIMAMLLKRQGKMRFSEVKIVNWDAEKSGQDWSRLRLINGSSMLCEIESLNEDAVTIIRSLVKEFCPRGYFRWIANIFFGDTSIPLKYWTLFFSRMLIMGDCYVKIASLAYLMTIPFMQIELVRYNLHKLWNPSRRRKISEGENRL